ncbi:MAG: LapA family protein [Bacteroidales bacterium]|nr:LapA family protein [Bacteroidales bacterium]
MKTKVVIIILLAVTLIVFVLQNTETVLINIFFWDISMPMALLLFVCFAIGVIIGLIIPSSRTKKAPDTDL